MTRALWTALACTLLALPAYPAVTVTAPGAGSGNVDGTLDAPTLLGSYSWAVTSNETHGATLSLSAPAFAHATEAGAEAMIELDLTRTSGSAWAVSSPTSTSTPSEEATVSAASDAPGDAAFRVDVSFVPGDASILPAGDYATTVTATIAALP